MTVDRALLCLAVALAVAVTSPAQDAPEAPPDPSGTWSSDIGELGVLVGGDRLAFSYVAVFGPTAHTCDGAGLATANGEGRWQWRDDASTLDLSWVGGELRLEAADGFLSFCGAGWPGDSFAAARREPPRGCRVSAERAHFHVVGSLPPEQRRAYVVRGDPVEVVTAPGGGGEGFVLGRFRGPRATTVGLLREQDLDCR